MRLVFCSCGCIIKYRNISHWILPSWFGLSPLPPNISHLVNCNTPPLLAPPFRSAHSYADLPPSELMRTLISIRILASAERRRTVARSIKMSASASIVTAAVAIISARVTRASVTRWGSTAPRTWMPPSSSTLRDWELIATSTTLVTVPTMMMKTFSLPRLSRE